jgi:hypothetical protein
VCQLSRFQHAGVQPLADQPQDSSIFDSLLDKLPQQAPVSIVDTSTYIRIDYPVDVQRPTLLPQLVPRLMGAVALPKAVGKGIKILVEDCLQDHDDCPLDNLVLKAGLAYWPLLPPFLLDPYPLDWRCHIPIVAQPLMQVPEVVLQVLSVLRGRYLVYPRGTVLAGQPIGFQKEVVVDQVQHVVEHHCWIALCLLRNALEFPGYGW